jgi:hydrogenase large subunit
MATIKMDPITRIEGHLGIEVGVDGGNIVTDVQCQGTMFRGFELIVQNRKPRDVVVLTSRICGV